MISVAFDTLKFARRLESAGFTMAQAQGASEALSETLGEGMVTKTHLDLTLREELWREELGPIKTAIERLSGRINLLQWMVGFNLTAVMAVLYILIRKGG